MLLYFEQRYSFGIQSPEITTYKNKKNSDYILMYHQRDKIKHGTIRENCGVHSRDFEEMKTEYLESSQITS
jgi:hypothetical protein